MTPAARLILDETDSTNAHLARLAPREPGPIWCLAHRQSAGRGRRGRAWHAPEGNFAASWLGRPNIPQKDWPRLSFVAALALAEAVEATAPDAAPDLALKWPNDLLLKGAKLAGILLETAGPAQNPALIIGFGVNLAAAPPPDQLEPGAVPATALGATTGTAPLPETLLDHLAPAFDRHLSTYTAHGFAPIRSAWRARATGLGAPIIAKTGAETHHGIFEDIDADGALILKTDAKRLVLPAADVYL